MIEVPEAGAEELGVERQPLKDYEAIRQELEAFDSRLAELPEVVAKLLQQARSHAEQPAVWSTSLQLDLDEMDIGQLRALGYAIH